MKTHYLFAIMFGFVTMFQANFVVGQNLKDVVSSTSDLTIEGEITYLDAKSNKIAVGDQTFHLDEIVQIDGEQRLADQAYQKLHQGTRVSITVNDERDQNYPLITTIQTKKHP